MTYNREYIFDMHTQAGDTLSINYFIDKIAPTYFHIYNACNNNLLTNQYAPCDIVGEYLGIPYYFELKVRKMVSVQQYPDSGLSRQKYDKLLQMAKDTNGVAYYVPFYLTGFALINLNTTPPDRYGEWTHKKTTEFNRQEMITETDCPFWNISNKINPYIYD